jgi:hypothetical protein
LRDAVAKLAEEGFEAVIGPMDGDTWSAHRLVIESDGSAPFLMEPHNPEHYPDAFEGAGFAAVARYVSADAPCDAPISGAMLPAGITLRAFDHADAERELARIHELSLRAFADNAFYRPIPFEQFAGMYRPVLGAIDPELAVMAEDDEGELVGFMFAIPDYAEGAEPRTAILKTCASLKRGLGGYLVREFHLRARDKGFARGVHALMHEDNPSTRLSARFGGRVFRRYALWGLRL